MIFWLPSYHKITHTCQSVKINYRLPSSKQGSQVTFQIESMRNVIQNLCQITIPLGKCIDMVFEEMNTELLKWKSEIKKSQSDLLEEQKKSKEKLQPLHDQLDEIKTVGICTEFRATKIGTVVQ